MAATLLFFLAVTVQVQPVVLDAGEAIDLAVSTAPTLQAALGRENAARLLARQARAWTNPILSTAAENVGATHEVTGISGLPGIEGQIVLGLTLPMGGDRAAAIARGSALERAASAVTNITERDVRVEVITTIALSERDATLATSAGEEAAALQRFATAIERRAEEGRASGGDAARATLERVIASSNAARRNADLAISQARLARILGLALGTPIRITAPQCVNAWAPGPGQSPDMGLAEAASDAASAQGRLSRAQRIPDLAPEVGFRRTGGFSSLFLGLSFELPLFTHSSDAVRAADAQSLAVNAEGDGTARRLEADVYRSHGARRCGSRIHVTMGRRPGPSRTECRSTV